MKRFVSAFVVLFTGLITFGCSDSQTSPRTPARTSYSLESGGRRQAFSIESDVISSTGQVVHLTGGGSFDPSTASNVAEDPTKGHGNGSFGCIGDFPSGPFAGCISGEGTHWDSEQLLESSKFKCGGFAAETTKTAITGDGVVVLQADFYKAGDGDNATFHAKMFVADHDLGQDVPGNQNVWIAGFGCGNAVVHFSN